jgi:hypothetical protein
MKIKTLLAVLALSFTPGLAMASCTGEDHAAMSCAEGHSYDQATKSCVPVTG